jgi:hypothetical protein
MDPVSGTRNATPESRKPATRPAMQFLIVLAGSRPRIWRRLQLRASGTFWDLHVAIQDAMGWLDCHLHQFDIETLDGPVAIGIPDDDSEHVLSGWSVPLTRYFKVARNRATYDYDFGDGWQHSILLEAIVPAEAGAKFPLCMDGAGACPPEDSGGIQSLAALNRIINNPNHREHESMKEWADSQVRYPPYRPGAFDPAEVVFDKPKQRLRHLY